MNTPHSRRSPRTLVRAFLTLSLLAGCEPVVSPDPPSNAGQLHDDGVRYVLERLDSINQPGLPTRVVQLSHEYCGGMRAATGRQCSNQARYPAFPLDAEAVVDAAAGSAPFKVHLRTLFRTGRTAPTLPVFVSAVDALERSADRELRGAERERFSDVASIARSSATFWAPQSQGGRNGGGTKLPSGGAALKTIDWKEVYEADALGCLVTIEIGCVEGAVAFSVADIIKQLAED